jgi:Fe-S-cluster-containing dehydrogenase component/DMSO reductase anchor subunit
VTDTLDPEIDPGATPLDVWRAAQGDSAVEAFAAWHSGDSSSSSGAACGVGRTARYEALLPASPPGPGEQYRFEVDLDACTGCKACVAACHSLNGLDEGETWRSVGLLVGGTSTAPWQQHVTTACHHCADPACLNGCPVDAYEKDPITGIVAHLDDQCIGCRYCQLTCPYEVPTFNSRLGVVRKCDLCSDRLADGEAPACVQGCPTEAISIGVVAVSSLTVDATSAPEVLASGPRATAFPGAAAVAMSPRTAGGLAARERLVPTAPMSTLTRPSTVYRSSRPIPVEVRAADDHRVVPATAHPPLALMLVLTQLSVGVFALTELSSLRSSSVATWIALATAVVALGASTLHLGRPLVAWRAVIGLGHSWLSREIVAFGLYAFLVGAVAGARVLDVSSGVERALSVAALGTGVAGVIASAKVYAVTGRRWWRFGPTTARFVVTGLLCGGASLGLVAVVAGSSDRLSSVDVDAVTELAAAVVVGSVLLQLAGLALLLSGSRSATSELGRTRLLLRGPLRMQVRWAAAGLAAAGVAAAMLAVLPFSPGAAVLGWVLMLFASLAASLIERTLFFTAAAPDRMPGALA